jgi:hypothetical protein
LKKVIKKLIIGRRIIKDINLAIHALNRENILIVIMILIKRPTKLP